ncbi:MAG: hypothetical protein MI723_05355, partial [Caulobacterales bacterium]|nr:hypothetical protein [Caulobacterales bacterium]
GDAYRLYRGEGDGDGFGDRSLAVEVKRTELLSAFAALDEAGQTLSVVLINKDTRERAVNLRLDRADRYARARAVGFDGTERGVRAIADAGAPAGGPVVLPAMSARRVDFFA